MFSKKKQEAVAESSPNNLVEPTYGKKTVFAVRVLSRRTKKTIMVMRIKMES